MSAIARRRAPAAWLVVCAGSLPLLSMGILRLARAENLPELLNLHGGKQIYEAACTACHGGGVLTGPQMDAVIVYLGSLCMEKGWPLGELNVPRALITEKAFPESETVLRLKAGSCW